MSRRPTDVTLQPPAGTVIDAVPPVAFSVAVEVPGPCVYEAPAWEMPTRPIDRFPGSVNFWAQVDFTVRQRIIAPQGVPFGTEVTLAAVSAVQLPDAEFGAEVTFSVVSSFRYVRTVQFSAAAALAVPSAVQLPALFEGRGDLAVVSTPQLPAKFGGNVTLSIASSGGFQFADAEFGTEVTFSVESIVRFTRTVDFSASAGLDPAALARFIRTAGFSGTGVFAIGHTAKAPLPAAFSGSAALSISQPIPRIPREIGFGGNVVLSILAEAIATRGMVKNGDQQFTAAGSWTIISGWTAESGSVVSSNMGLTANGISGPVTIQVGATWATGVRSHDWRVRKNAIAVIWMKGTGTGASFDRTFTTTLAEGDVLTVEGWINSGVNSERIVIGGAGTYLRIVPA